MWAIQEESSVMPRAPSSHCRLTTSPNKYLNILLTNYILFKIYDTFLKMDQLKERKRIQEAGGFIAFNGVWRVAGILATSRALGDFPLKVIWEFVCIIKYCVR